MPQSSSYALTDGWMAVLLFALLGFVLSLLVSFVQPLKYSSTVRLLILQNVGAGVDAYTASRSEERLAENLSTLIHTSTFFDLVLASGFSVDPNDFPPDARRRRRAWNRTVATTVARGNGLLTVSAFHRDVREAEKIARAVAFVLTQNAAQFTSGSGVQARLIDSPLNSRWPVKPNIPVNAFSGLVLGALVGVGYVFLRRERMRRRHQFAHD